MSSLPRSVALIDDCLGIPGEWKRITEQVGMFCILGLSLEQVLELRGKSNQSLKFDRPILRPRREVSRLHGGQLSSFDCGLELEQCRVCRDFNWQGDWTKALSELLAMK